LLIPGAGVANLGIQHLLLGSGHGGHEAQIAADSMAFAELAKAGCTKREDVGGVGEADARNPALRERFNLFGI